MIHRGYSKRRRVDTQVLHPEIVRRLKAWLKTKTVAADALLFPVSAKVPGGTERRTADMMRADLLVAKRKWIDEVDDEAERRRRRKSDFLEYEDDNNRFADFQPRAAAGGGATARRFDPAPSGSSNRPPGLHARHTFITNLKRAGVSPRTWAGENPKTGRGTDWRNMFH